MKKFRRLILVFFTAISVPLGFVIWQTYAGLEREERGQLQYFSETLFDQMQRELAYLVQREENRAVDEYQYYLAQLSAGEQRPQQRSPLSEQVYNSYILGYLQNNPDGSFQTPLVADMDKVPEEEKDIVLQLKEANRIFNDKKYSLLRKKPDATADMETLADMLPAEEKSRNTFSERYIAPSKTISEKAYLGKKKQRIEEISAEQALNVSSEDNLLRQSPTAAENDALSSPAAGRVRPKYKDLRRDELEQQGYVPAAKPLAEQDRLQAGSAGVFSAQPKFQAEVAPFQSVSIKDDQIYMFRRIVINNQIFRQGFILLVEPFLEHLVNSHFIGQPLARYTTIQLQRRDKGQTRTIVQAGVPDVPGYFIAERIFPAPFDFLSVALSAQEVPPSPARSSLRAALVALGACILLGLFAIYRSARTIVEMSERRSQFVSSVTHELKTPLTNIRMYIEMLEQGIASTPEREQKYLAILSSESSRLSSLINNVLELAKLERKQRHFNLQQGQIADTLAEVEGIMAQKLKQDGFTLDVEVPDLPLLSYDREALIQILINLIENSVKFGRMSARRQITIRADMTDQHVRLTVSDHGPGIPKQELKKIFDDFYRVDNDLTRVTSGTGIGLALVKKLITGMGGSVQATNNRGPGCTITVLLQRNRAARAAITT